MENSQSAIAPYYAGDIMTMIDNNEDLDYAMPKDGANLFYDAMCIPKCSKNKENAEKFINFMQDPEIAAANFEYLNYATPNQVAYDDYIDEDAKKTNSSSQVTSILTNAMYLQMFQMRFIPICRNSL